MVYFTGLEPAIKFWWYDEEAKEQLFPFRTLAMIVSIIVLCVSAIIVHVLFQKKLIPEKLDVLGAFKGSDIEEFHITKVLDIHGFKRATDEYEVNGKAEHSEEVELMSSKNIDVNENQDDEKTTILPPIGEKI